MQVSEQSKDDNTCTMLWCVNIQGTCIDLVLLSMSFIEEIMTRKYNVRRTLDHGINKVLNK